MITDLFTLKKSHYIKIAEWGIIEYFSQQPTLSIHLQEVHRVFISFLISSYLRKTSKGKKKKIGKLI